MTMATIPFAVHSHALIRLARISPSWTLVPVIEQDPMGRSGERRGVDDDEQHQERADGCQHPQSARSGQQHPSQRQSPEAGQRR